MTTLPAHYYTGHRTFGTWQFQVKYVCGYTPYLKNVPLINIFRYYNAMDMNTLSNAREYDEHAKEWHEHASVNHVHVFLEKPAMEAELPQDLFGKTVLCIGAGSGEELAFFVKRNAKHIIATDISSNLLEIASKNFPDVECRVMDMMSLEFPDETFDLVYSSLAFHYTNDWDTLLAGVYKVLKRGGVLLFSTHNPGYWSKHPTGTVATNARGITLTEHTATLPGGIHITYYNHPDTASIDEAVTHAGFSIVHSFTPSVVPAPTLPPTERKKYENMAATNAETPLFYIVRATRA